MTLDQARAFQAHGLTLSFYATYVLAFELLFVVVWFLAATLIFWRKSEERLAWFVSLMLLKFGATYVDPPGCAPTTTSHVGIACPCSVVHGSRFPRPFPLSLS